MKIDSYNTIVMEQTGYPGNIGDSCAETARYVHLSRILGLKFALELGSFFTDKGMVRHPTAPPGWREDDFTTDQCLPLYLAVSSCGMVGLVELVEKNIIGAGYKTGNGDLISPVFFALLKKSKFLLDMCLLVQIALFKLPIRWSDSKKWFESTKDMSGDYLNFIHAAIYASPYIRRFVGKEKLMDRVRHYYKPEPNCALLLGLYEQVIEHFWR